MGLELVDDDFTPCEKCEDLGIQVSMCASCENNHDAIERYRAELLRERAIVNALIVKLH